MAAQYAKLKSRFPEIISLMPVRVGSATRESARLVAANAKARAPIGDPGTDPHPGRLRSSIRIERDESVDAVAEWHVVATATDDKGVPYAHMVELGSVHNQPPRPFMVPAFEQTKAEAVALHKLALLSALGGVGNWSS